MDADHTVNIMFNSRVFVNFRVQNHVWLPYSILLIYYMLNKKKKKRK